jgi:hypothetical protein
MANAQENKDTYFKDAISYALENKADAKKAKLKVKTANTKFRKFVRALPKISANGSLTYNPILQTTFLDAGSFGGEPGTTIQATFENGFLLLVFL